MVQLSRYLFRAHTQRDREQKKHQQKLPIDRILKTIIDLVSLNLYNFPLPW